MEESMKRLLILAVIFLLAGLAALGQRRQTIAPAPASLEQVRRDTRLEKAAAARAEKIDSVLQPEAKTKLDLITRRAFTKVATGPENIYIYAIVQQEVDKEFPGLSAEQSDLLYFYVLAGISRVLSNPQKYKENLDGAGKLSEAASVRLQMMLDRRSKFFTTLSNIISKISKTEDAIVANIK
jgi:hypothetical protein